MTDRIVSRAGRSAWVVALAVAGCSGSMPLKWQKVESSSTGLRGSVLGLDSPGTFDEVGNFTVTAFKENGVTSLYYGGADATGKTICPNSPAFYASHWRIGLAQSSDGVNFTRVPGSETGGAIVDLGAPGAFDSYLTYRPYVLHDGATYRMWYNGATMPFNDCNAPAGQNPLALDRRIGYAESTDGVHWTKFYDGAGPGGSVLALGAPGAIDAQQVGYVGVIKDAGQYKMYYSANDATNTWRVALAVSSDARHWTKVPGPNANGSVLDIGPPGAFDVACAYQPSVVKDPSGLYRMWYRGCQAPSPLGGPSQGVIGYAESWDGLHFVKVNAGLSQGEALDKGAAGQFDSGGLTTPSVFLDGSTWNMYYAGFDASVNYLAGLARAPAN